jgi:hypothetical protein
MNNQPIFSKPKIFYCVMLIFFLGSHQVLYAQNDSLLLKNDDIIVGEIKSMDRGVLTIETDYSDKDFKIEWSGITEIHAESFFLISLSDGRRYNGTLESLSPGRATINIVEGGTTEVDLMDLVFLKSIDEGFWSRIYAAIDVGYSLTKANNLRQFSLNGKIGYLAERWSLDASYNSVLSKQDSVADTKRTDGNITYRYFLPKDWFMMGDISFLSNTEQKLNLRSNGKLGLGKFMIHTNSTYWAFQAGASVMNENFSDESPDRQSMEGFLGTELNMFDVGDLGLLTNVTAFPGITESGRWRVDFKFDLKYDLPLDFYVKLGFTINYDNQPVEGASDTDYVFQTGFGWEW